MSDPIPDATLCWWEAYPRAGRANLDRLIAAYRESQAENERLGSFVDCPCERGHVVAIDDGDGGVYSCPVCALAALQARISQRIEAWIRHGEAVPADVTTYDRAIVHMELRDLAASLLSASTDRADWEAL